ncbi:MAG TPA: hypothetical protein VG994_09485 [Steroidobacteraceae bacterium]|nr:hypothetical protein [Steroidobacteraceae bacterium]
MLSWNVERGVIRELRKDGTNLILPWGIETADSSGFFSLEPGIGYRHTRLAEHSRADERSSSTQALVAMPEGLWNLTLEDRIEASDLISRTAALTTVDDTVLMDFVVRLRFRKSLFHTAHIADRTLEHRASDVYNQYPVRSARLDGRDFSVRIDIEESQCTPALVPMLYVRDHADEWIVHARMIPCRYHKEVIKICNGWAGTRSLPLWLSRALLAVPGVRSRLWYRNERRPYPRLMRRLFNPNAFPLALLPKGESLRWRLRVQIA